MPTLTEGHSLTDTDMDSALSGTGSPKGRAGVLEVSLLLPGFPVVLEPWVRNAPDTLTEFPLTPPCRTQSCWGSLTP